MSKKPIKKRTDFSGLRKVVDQMEVKYRKLVWYARKPPYENVDTVYSDSPVSIREGCKRAMAKVEELYPKELNQYHAHPDWTHGFNSGCLAAFRLIELAMDDEYYEDYDDEEIGDWNQYHPTGKERLEIALEFFPSLDT